MIATVYRPKRRKDGRKIVARLYRGKIRLDGDAKITYVALKTPDKGIAQKRLNAMISEVQREREGMLPSKRLREGASTSLANHAKDFVAELRTKGRSRQYFLRIEQRLTKLFQECQWSSVRELNPDGFLCWRRNQVGLTPKTLNEYLASVRTLLNWMRRVGRIDGNPFDNIERIDARGKASFERRALTVEELKALRAVSGPRWPVYLFAAKTGLRRGEMRQLQWGDVELETGALALRASTTKNRRDTTLPLDGEVVEGLRALKPKGAKASALVFHKRVPRRETVKRDFEAAGIPILDDRGRKVDLHAFRNTYCTLLAQAEVPERQRQELMRHSDPRLTNRTYTDVRQLPLRAAIAKLPRLGDSQGDSQSLVPASHSETLCVTSGQSGNDPKSLQNKANRHGATRSGTTCPDDRKTGGGGNRLCRGVRSIAQNTTSSPHRRSTRDI